MPITSSAIKAARQTIVRQKRRQPVKTLMKTMIRTIEDLVKEGKKKDAEAKLPALYKAIDMAAKRNIIHPNNASRKKSRLARLVATK